MRNYPMIGRRAIKRCGWPRKKKVKMTERREWREEYTDEQLYPELDDDE
jgi:hypothetical protein